MGCVMQKLNFLNTKEVKEIRKKILGQWGCDFKTDLAFILTNKNRIFLLSRDVEKIDFEKLIDAVTREKGGAV